MPGTGLPPVVNEPSKLFPPGSAERDALKAACIKVRSEVHKIPVVINGMRYYPGTPKMIPIPSDNKIILCECYEADEKMLHEAAEAAIAAHKEWSRTPFKTRAAVMLKAATLLTTTHRYRVQAACMVGQSKNPWQSEIDAVGEAADFLRFHTSFAAELMQQQPNSPAPASIWNQTDYRPLEGFVVAISPFNFTAIGTNLAATPALMGNTVLWKPSRGSLLSNYWTFELLEEAGLPPGVINFVPCHSPSMEKIMRRPEFAGVAFTGSTRSFQSIWKNISENLPGYRNFPRISGETGGKNFHLVHPSAHIPTVAATTVRSAFEYQGQKCSACSRLFAPASKWPAIKEAMLSLIKQIKIGQPDDFENFMNALIDEAAFDKNVRYLDIARKEGLEVVCGGKASKEKGWFVDPTILLAKDLNATTMKEEIFGPILTVYVYNDLAAGFWEKICDDVDKSSEYGLTGSIFARDRNTIAFAQDRLRYASGMLYINDKSTGAVVGQQPFGGARKSGTNDKPGGRSFVERWVTPRTVKEAFEPQTQVSYPHQLPDDVRATE